ncbi:MAG: hypothetical protein ACYC69_10530 [Thermodesulfovibrionales bacterium]
MNSYTFIKIDHRPGGNAEAVRASVRQVFASGVAGLNRVREAAQEIALMIDGLDDYQEQAAEAVCPECGQVCCINRHAHHEHEDIIYLYALGYDLPEYQQGIEDTAACQFLAGSGCTINRTLRPHRCNAYFCSPFLETMQQRPAPEYRRLMEILQLITLKREEMLLKFYILKQGLQPAGPEE